MYNIIRSMLLSMQMDFIAMKQLHDGSVEI